MRQTFKCWGKKRNSIPMQNRHDLLVDTLSIGIPSLEIYLINQYLYCQ